MKHLKLFMALLALVGVNLTAKAQTSWTGVSEITDGGQYYLQNATTGYFIGASSWYGTFAVASEAPTSSVTVNLVDGKYQIKFDYGGNGLFAENENGWCYTDRNNQDHYLWNIVKEGDYFTIQLPTDDSFYVEGGYLAPTGTAVGDNIGFKQTNEYRYWKFISRDEIETAIFNATESNPVDVSILVNGWDCGPGKWISGGDNESPRKNVLNRLGYTFTGSGWKLQNSEQPNFTNFFIECWTGSALGNASATRTLTGLPSGHYKVSAYVKGGANIKMFIRDNNGTETTVDTEAGDPTLISVETNSQGELTYGFKMENTTAGWFAFDNVKLEAYYIDPLLAAKENLEKAKANINEIAEGTVPAIVFTNLQDLEASSPVEETQEAYDALITSISQAISNAKALVAPFDRYKKIKAAVKAISDTIDTSESDEMADNAETEEALENAVTAVRKILTDYLETATLNDGETINLTAALVDNATVTTREEAIKYWNPSTQEQFNFSDNVGEFWNQSAASISQTLKNMPEGKYELNIVALTRTTVTGGVIFANDNQQSLVQVESSSINNKSQANTWFEGGNGVNTLEFFTSNVGDINIGLQSGTTGDKWTVFKSFELIYKGKVLMADADDYAALATAIETAESNTLGFETDEYAPYNNIEAIKALVAAKTIDPEAVDGNLKEVVQNATSALTEAEWTANTEEVNAFFDGAFASEYSHEGNVMPIGWHAGDGVSDNATNMRLMWNSESNAGLNATSSKQGAFAKFTALYGTEPGYTLPLKAGVYSLKFIFGGWNEKATREIKVYNAENVAVVTPSSITAKDNKAHTTVDSWSTYEGFVTIPADGDYTFSFYRQSTSSQNQLVFSDITLFKAKPETVTIKAGRQYTAFSSAKALDFTGTGLKAEIVVSATGATQEVTKVPANTGVIVGLAEAATEETKIAVPVCVGETDDVTDNMLVAVVESTAIAQIDGDNTNYVFGKKNGKEAFFKVPAAGMTVPANNAYLSVPTATGAKEVIFLGGETTGISHVDADAVEGDIYTVSGVKVQKAQKGVYIVNGKKLIVK